MNISAIVPMRHISERIPGKNYRTFNGKPLFHYIIETLIETSIFDNIIVDTDSPVIKEDVQQNFPEITVSERPDHLRDEHIPMNDILLNTINSLGKTDFYLQTHTTNPLLSGKSVKDAVLAFMSGFPIYDSLFSVNKLQTRLWDGLTRAINHNPSILLRTQDLPPVFEENSCLYLFSKESLLRYHNRIGARPMMWEISGFESHDIDEEIDFRIAEFLHAEHRSGRLSK